MTAATMTAARPHTGGRTKTASRMAPKRSTAEVCRHAPGPGRRGLYKPHGWLPARSAGRTSTTSASSWSSPASAKVSAASTAPSVHARSPAPRGRRPDASGARPPRRRLRNGLVRSRRLVGRARGGTRGQTRARRPRGRDRRGRSSRRDDGAPRHPRRRREPTVRPQALAPPARYAADSADRIRASAVAVQKRSVRRSGTRCSRRAGRLTYRARPSQDRLDADTHTRTEGCPARTPRHGRQDADLERRLGAKARRGPAGATATRTTATATSNGTRASSSSKHKGEATAK